MKGRESMEGRGTVKIKKAAAVFLAVMAALTFLSRALDSVTVTKVEIGYGKQGVVPYLIQGEGELTASRMIYVSLPEGMQVDELVKKPGQNVKAGETVLRLQMEGLKEEWESLELEMRQARISLEQQRLSVAPVPRVTEETLALQQVAAAQRALAIGSQELEDAREEHAFATADLEHEYVQKKNRTREEVKEDNRKAMKSARRAHEAAELAREAAVRKAEREVEDKRKKLERLEAKDGSDGGTEASEEELDRAKVELERAEEDLNDIRQEQDLEVEEARAKMYAAEEAYEDVDYSEEEAKEELRKAYEDAVKAEDHKLLEAEKKIRDLNESLYQAMEKLENARVSDAGVLAEEAAQKEIWNLKQESIKLDMEQIEKKQKKIEDLIAAQGQISAFADGIVAETGLEAGEQIQPGDQLKVAVGGLSFTAKVDKETAGLLRQGTKMKVKLTGQSKEVETEVESVDQMPEDGTAQIMAVLPEGKGTLGGNAHFTVNMESEAYSCVIPIEALREDNAGYYCLAAEPVKTILGEEMQAVRINVEILEKSTRAAAVSGPIGTETKLVTESDKAVSEGDRVRVVE